MPHRPPLPEFDYGRYWRAAWSAAMVEQRARRADHAASRRAMRQWPRVFVYDLRPPLSDWSPQNATQEEVFGPTLNWTNENFLRFTGGRRIRFENTAWGTRETRTWWKDVPPQRLAELSRHVRNSNHYGFARALLYRLWHSKRYRTLDPAEADLFFVPVISTPMRGVQITVNCTEHPRHELSAALPHLTKANAHRHVLVLAKEHYEGWACLGWWANPRGHFRHMQRLSYSEVVPDEARADVAYYKRLRCETLLAEPNCPIYPHLTSVPYLSTVHWPPASNSAATSTELSDSELEGTGRGSSMAGTSRLGPNRASADTSCFSWALATMAIPAYASSFGMLAVRWEPDS